MSTRSVIARKTPVGFKGIYHHWNGYPSGLGKTLFKIHSTVFGSGTARMLRYLIDDHPAGWSTINSDWSKPEGQRPDENMALCETCQKPSWRHYRQYYVPSCTNAPSAWERAGRPPIPAEIPSEVIAVLGHNPKCQHLERGPEPQIGEAWEVTQDNASGSGCEYAYVFEEELHIMHIQSSYCDPKSGHGGKKMIGAFGCGDEKAIWRTIETVDLNGVEPEWDKITS